MKFELDEDERTKLDVWDEAHLTEHHGGEEPYCGAIGGRVVFTITNTSIGTILGVYCCTCRSKGKTREEYSECLTDFSDW